jgi:hypothetical protein
LDGIVFYGPPCGQELGRSLRWLLQVNMESGFGATLQDNKKSQWQVICTQMAESFKNRLILSHATLDFFTGKLMLKS